MKRSYTKIYDFLMRFLQTGELIREIDTSQWTTDKIAGDSVRRCIKRKGMTSLCLIQRGEKMYVLNVDRIERKQYEIESKTGQGGRYAQQSAPQ